MTAPEFIYHEATSELYGPDGLLLKKVFCPKAKQWDQLSVDDPQDRSRGCDECGDRVLDLDACSTQEVLEAFAQSQWRKPCVYARRDSPRVLVLRDPSAKLAPPSRSWPPQQQVAQGSDRVVIQTVRTIEDINRAAGAGFWPDIRLVEYREDILKCKLCVIQEDSTGRVEVLGDYRAGVPEGWTRVIDFTKYYPHYQAVPVAAYLLPEGLQNGQEVLVADPIDDIAGASWNQGSVFKARNVPGFVQERRVVLRPSEVAVMRILG